VRDRRRADRRALAGSLLGLLLAAASATAAPPDAPTPAPSREELNLATFDRAWTLVAETHWDPNLGGVDWPAVRDELRPKARSAPNDRELRRVLEEMTRRLGQSHFALLPGAGDDSSTEATRAEDGDDLLPGCAPAARAAILTALDHPAQAGEPGLELRLLENAEDHEVVVTRVIPGGPAASAGVRPGFRLVAVEGRPLARRLACFDAIESPSFRRQLVASWLRSLLEGSPGTQVRLRFDASAGRNRDLLVWREPPTGVRVGFGNLPPTPFRFELAEISTAQRATVELVRFNLWLMPVAAEFEKAMPRLRQADAVVVDLRGNPGGIAAIAQGVASHFVDEALSLGTMKGRRDDLELVVEPRRVARDGSRVEPYAGPLAILIDEGSASTSELFAAGLRDHGRARLFGQPSAGAALPAVMDRLPNGDIFMHAAMDYVRPNGERVEGQPIVPDVETPLRRDELLAGRDAPLDAALAWIDREIAERSTPSEPRRSGAD
jgi:carboxyl-terminal processing protease